MAVLLRCPSGHRLRVPSKFAGRRIACPVCDAKIDVPGQPAAKPAPTKKPSPLEETSVAARQSDDSESRVRSRRHATSKSTKKSSKGNVATPNPNSTELNSSRPKTANSPDTSSAESASAAFTKPNHEVKNDGTIASTTRQPSHVEHSADGATDLRQTSSGNPTEGNPAQPAPNGSNMELSHATEPSANELSLPASVNVPVEQHIATFGRSVESAFEEQSEASEHRDSSRAPASAEVPEFSIRPIDNRFLDIASAQSRRHQTQCMALAVASLGIAAVCLFPSLLEQTMSRQIGLRAPDVWSYWVILLCVVQIGLSLLAVRVPDWSTTWLLTLTATGVSAVYAAGLALTMFANQDHALLRRLGLLDEVVRTRAQPWCFFILCLGLILAYASGRCSVAWHHQEQSRLQP